MMTKTEYTPNSEEFLPILSGLEILKNACQKALKILYQRI